MSDSTPRIGSPAELIRTLETTGYLADDGVAMAAFLALRMGRPLFCEGEPGTGKTSLAAAIAEAFGLPLIRLQCHEGIDAAQALYDWDFPRQLLHLRTLEAASGGELQADTAERSLYTERFLLARPLLRALTEAPCVLLVDEIDRADDEFEAFLLQVLDENAVTIPELGEVRAAVPPVVVLTSNRTREVHDALKRRCLYVWLEHPDLAREVAILRRRIPGIDAALADQVAAAVRALRAMELLKPPGVAESLDWARALRELGRDVLDAETAAATLGAVLKYREDLERVARTGLDRLLAVIGMPAVPGGPLVGVAGFAHALAAAGLPVGPDAVATFTRALGQVDLSDAGQVYWTGRATLCRSPDDIPRYHLVFESWFGGTVLTLTGQHAEQPRRAATAALNTSGKAAGGDEPGLRVAADDTEILRHRDIAELTTAERAHLAELIATLRPRQPTRPALRLRPSRRGPIDPRRTVRSMLAAGGEPVRPRRHRKSTRPRRVVLLIDVSGSMSPYADALLRFAHVVARADPAGVEVFSLGTRMTRLSRALRARDPESALVAAGRAVPDWAGGTRLGETLRAFLDRWGRRGLARGAVVVIFSDGWERGDAGLLAEQMAHLRRLARSVLWVNPHAGVAGYQPVQSGITAALPFTDRLLAGHSLATLQDLLEQIHRA